MPRGLKRYYGTGEMHFITWSCYRRQPLLDPTARKGTASDCPRTHARALRLCGDRIRGHARARASADFRTFDWQSLKGDSGREAWRFPATGYERRLFRPILATPFLRFQSVEPTKRG